MFFLVHWEFNIKIMMTFLLVTLRSIDGIKLDQSVELIESKINWYIDQNKGIELV